MKNKINVLIIDDEISFISSLEIMLKMNFPYVNILGTAGNVNDAVTSIRTLKPDLIFLDINLPDGDGFDVLEQNPDLEFKTIFTTSMSEFAVRAFEFSALHYLLKPLELDKLTEALSRYDSLHDSFNFETKLKILKDSLPGKPEKIFLPLADGHAIFNISDIVRCEADDNCCFVYMNDGKKLHIAKSLNAIYKALCDLDFVRIHSKHLVSLRYISQYKSGRLPRIILNDGYELPISQTYKSDLVIIFKDYARTI